MNTNGIDMNAESRPLSSSALAKALGKTTKQMFSELESLGWIKRSDDSWLLTGKGEFEGGNYRESQKFGRYIVWPASVVKHKALTNPDMGLMSVAKLAKELGLAKQQTGFLLRALGWAKMDRKGWVITAQGEAVGGVQREENNTGIPFVLWPESLTENEILKCWLDALSGHGLEGCYACFDGHEVASDAGRRIDNWLYLAGITHAVNHPLPCHEKAYADFYLPVYQLYIEYWGDQVSGNALSEKMHRRDLYQAHKLRVIEITDTELEDLDMALPRLFLKQGIEI